MLLAETYRLYNQNKKPRLEDTANICARNSLRMQQSHWLKTVLAESLNHCINVDLFVLEKGVKVTWDLVEGGKKTLLFIRFQKCLPTTAAFLI